MVKLISQEELKQVQSIQDTAKLIAQLVIKRFNETRIDNTSMYRLDNRMLQMANAVCSDVQISESGLRVRYHEADNEYDNCVMFIPADVISDTVTLDKYINTAISEWYKKRYAEIKSETEIYEDKEYQEYLRLKEKYEETRTQKQIN